MRADSTLGPKAFSRTVSGEPLAESFVSLLISEGARNNNTTARQENAIRERSRLPSRRKRMPTSYRYGTSKTTVIDVPYRPEH
jgi:hypothetical protein